MRTSSSPSARGFPRSARGSTSTPDRSGRCRPRAPPRWARGGGGRGAGRPRAPSAPPTPPAPRLVSVSHVLWATGAVLPVARIAALARERGALLVVDGAQAAGAIPVSVRDLCADAYSVAAQKWLLGPEGMGALGVARESMDRIRPSFGGHFSFAAYDSVGTGTWHPDARRFETAGYHRPP